MRKEILLQLQSEYQLLQQRDQEEDERRQEEAIARDPRIGQLLAERQDLIFSSIRGIFANKTASSTLNEDMAAKNEEIRQAVVAAGFPEDQLEPHYRCPICHDRGYVGDTIQEMCQCMRKEFYRRLYREVGLNPNKPQTFATFDLSIFPDENIPGHAFSQRRQMEMFKGKCEKWANSFPECGTADVFMRGSSGLGKTFLMNCMADVLLQRGFSVLTMTAYKFLEIARQEYFSEKSQSDMMRDILTCDVLMLDDLGSEPLLNNVTVSQFFNVLNERQTNGKSTVISTNLTIDEFKQRYGERMASRLSDPRTCLTMQFYGDDVRRR